jgi:hypothetical protein
MGSVLVATISAACATSIEDLVVVLILDCIRQSRSWRKFKMGNLEKVFYRAVIGDWLLVIG